jgi:hypothetical protein
MEQRGHGGDGFGGGGHVLDVLHDALLSTQPEKELQLWLVRRHIPNV